MINHNLAFAGLLKSELYLTGLTPLMVFNTNGGKK